MPELTCKCISFVLCILIESLWPGSDVAGLSKESTPKLLRLKVAAAILPVQGL